ncbi:class I SAM-dependent methyltransferase [Desulfobacula phenolica]|uniref:Protein-L-isoaspartate(D-aspartate) O-methyltransferase n=1 Tax=Desulfobacula phenolica TaxID=90732 RepID=A0A1H2DRV6_9BACT|nr:class I SAM-dependent methyltransferase [Desulfobacula phenolica]SDT85514.1 protein-L-isoaspartate(D-aspartate) O-methyltransferase [Desulfobacula phenolica]
MAYIDFISSVHKSTKRDYLKRVNEFSKAEAAEKAKKWGYDYWDGDRQVCYGGYHYDGRWKKVADEMVEHYQLKSGDRVLDVGCGKGFLLYEFTQSQPGLEVVGLDISDYAIKNAKPEIKPYLQKGHAKELPFEDNSFDLVVSVTTLHNLYCMEFFSALKEIQRVSKNSYVCVESYRNEQEKVNLLYWQVTCEMFCTPEEWEWWFDMAGYKGDHSLIFFE